jgi:hypothetical protein
MRGGIVERSRECGKALVQRFDDFATFLPFETYGLGNG